MIGVRIKEERERLGLSQPAFGEIAAAAKRTVIDWEKGVSSPTATQLAAFATAGADVQYIVTGVRRGQGIGESAVQQAVLDAVDLLSLEKKVDAQQLAKAVVKLCSRSVTSAAPGGVSSVIHGDVGNQIGSNAAPITINMGSKKK